MKTLTLILGGARSGKSAYAEQLAIKSGRQVLYVATAEGGDEEMVQRIERHRAGRAADWVTLEVPLAVGLAIEKANPQGVVILDCITLLASNILMQHTLNDVPAPEAEQAIAGVTERLLATYRTGSASWIVVSNEVGMGLVPPYPLGRVYRDALGRANKLIAYEAYRVILMIAGLPWKLKPVEQ